LDIWFGVQFLMYALATNLREVPLHIVMFHDGYSHSLPWVHASLCSYMAYNMIHSYLHTNNSDFIFPARFPATVATQSRQNIKEVVGSGHMQN
jgi:hypothetical protein